MVIDLCQSVQNEPPTAANTSRELRYCLIFAHHNQIGFEKWTHRGWQSEVAATCMSYRNFANASVSALSTVASLNIASRLVLKRRKTMLSFEQE